MTLSVENTKMTGLLNCFPVIFYSYLSTVTAPNFYSLQCSDVISSQKCLIRPHLLFLTLHLLSPADFRNTKSSPPHAN